MCGGGGAGGAAGGGGVRSPLANGDAPRGSVSLSDRTLVSETLRCLVAQVEYAAARGAPPSRYCHAGTGAVRQCRFGAACRRKDAAWHWVEADHPDDHPLMGLPAPPPAPFRVGEQPNCRHFIEKGLCVVGDKCRFRHEPTLRGSAPLPENHRFRATPLGEKRSWRQRGRKNQNRGAVFRRWLIDKFGHARLNSGSGVLDVAGGGAGGGGLAFSLLNYSGIRATIIDPR